MLRMYMGGIEESKLDKIIDEFGTTHYDMHHRLNYLTFKSEFLPKILSELHIQFNDLSSETFDDFFQKSIRRYERLF